MRHSRRRCSLNSPLFDRFSAKGSIPLGMRDDQHGLVCTCHFRSMYTAHRPTTLNHACLRNTSTTHGTTTQYSSWQTCFTGGDKQHRKICASTKHTLAPLFLLHYLQVKRARRYLGSCQKIKQRTRRFTHRKGQHHIVQTPSAVALTGLRDRRTQCRR